MERRIGKEDKDLRTCFHQDEVSVPKTVSDLCVLYCQDKHDLPLKIRIKCYLISVLSPLPNSLPNLLGRIKRVSCA